MTRQEIKARAKAQLGYDLFGTSWLLAVLAVLIVGAITGFLSTAIPFIGGAATLILIGPLSYGLAYLFLKQTRDGQPMRIGDLFNGFTQDFSDNLLLGLMQTIFISLWSLLLVVPGIVKSYAYSMSFYIKLDNPALTWNQCLNASQQMMRGHKSELFIQDLSFIGWAIIGSLCLGVGTLWVAAYVEASRSQFYEQLRFRQAAEYTAAAADQTSSTSL